MSDNRIPDLLTVMLIPIPRLVLPDPGAVIPDPTPFFAFDLWSHIPCYDPVLSPFFLQYRCSRSCCLSDFTLTNWAPALTGPHFSMYECKENVRAFPRDKENWPFHSDVKLLHCVNQVRPICWKCWVLRIILRNFEQFFVTWTVPRFVFGRFLSKTKRFSKEFYLSLKTGVEDHGIALAERCRKNWIWLVCTAAL